MRNNLIKVAAAVPELKIGDITYNTEKIIGIGFPVTSGRLAHAE